jgi:protein-tyrosine phosphatase
MKKILCVCLGNICRSPAAEGIFRHKLLQNGLEEGIDFLIDSAGTGDWHIGSPPDFRSISICQNFGIDISGLRGRTLLSEDAERFDHILGMDAENIKNIAERFLPQYHSKVSLIDEQEVADPYYGNEESFEVMFRQLDSACQKWIDQWEF